MAGQTDKLPGIYPDGANNPHVVRQEIEGGWFIEPKRGEAEAAFEYSPEPVDTERSLGSTAIDGA